MEWIFADIINSTKVPKVVKYIAITLLVGFLEFLFISIAINGVSKFAMPVGISLAIIFFNECLVYPETNYTIKEGENHCCVTLRIPWDLIGIIPLNRRKISFQVFCDYKTEADDEIKYIRLTTYNDNAFKYFIYHPWSSELMSIELSK